MLEEDIVNALEVRSKGTTSNRHNGSIESSSDQTYVSMQNYDIGCFRSPIIPQVQAHGFGSSIVFQLSISTLIQLDAVQKRIDKSHWICDYADDIFQTLRDSEMKRRLIGFRSQQVEYRPILLKLLKDATEKHKLARTTLHLAVYLLDCFMDHYTIRFDKLKLTAITCLIVAAKIEETDVDMPKFADLNELVNKSYQLQDFKNVECKVLGTFNFDLIRPTTATFAEYFANSLITLQDYHVYVNHWNNEFAYNQYHQRKQESQFQEAQETDYAISNLHPIISTPCPYSSYEDMLNTLSKTFFTLIDVSLNYLKFANARPSIIASACIAAVRQIHGVFPIWTPYLVKLTACTADIISPFVEAVMAIYRIHCNRELLQHINTPNTPTNGGSNASNANVLCDSPDSGIVLDNDTKSTTSEDETDNCELLHNENGDDTDEEDEPYNCLEYPLLPKRRRIF